MIARRPARSLVGGLATAVLAAWVAGCTSAPPRPADLAHWRAERAAIDSLASLDSLDAALALTHSARADARSSRAPAWFVTELTEVERALVQRASMPPAARAALALADREQAKARLRASSDSLGAAVQLCRAVWSTRRDLLGTGALPTAEATLDLAGAEMALAHRAEADSFAHEARALLGARLGEQHPLVADAEEILGRILKDFSGRAAFAPALAHYQAALRIRTANEGPRSLPVAETLQDMGNLYRLAERSDEAFAAFRRALDIRRQILGPVHDQVGSILSAMAYLSAGHGRWAEAESLSHAAVIATPVATGAPRGGLSLRLALRGTALRHLGRYAEAETVLAQALAVRESIWAQSPRDEGSSIMGGLAAYRDLALAIAAQGRGDEAFEQLERGSARTLVGRLTGGADPLRNAWQGLLPRVQQALHDDEAMISWPRTATTMFVADYPMYACVVRKHGPVQWIRLDRRTPAYHGIGTIREALWIELRAAAMWPRRVTETAATSQLEELMWRERFAPLEGSLAGVRRIVVCSTDFLNGGPLGVLRDDQGRWLADRFTISYTTSALLFARDRERGPNAGGLWARPALLVGNPAYPKNDPGRWPLLAGSAEEVRGLAARLPAATMLTGTEARASLLREFAADGSLGRFSLIHFAAHTAIDPGRVLESALVLAPDRPGEFSSRLTAREIIDHWHLNAEVVSLAACRSSGGMSSSTEGALGLQQAFLAAGARSLLVSLWPVEDRATARLMETFYALLTDRQHPRGAAQALREAQATLRDWRDPDGARPFAHPAYWGAFALIGDPG